MIFEIIEQYVTLKRYKYYYRWPIINPSKGLNPIEVSKQVPLLETATLHPFPR